MRVIGILPYNFGDEQLVVVDIIAETRGKTAAADVLPCLLCNQVLNRKDMRGHVGCHIVNNEAGPNPCGFCGMSDSGCSL
jgi:hypothetical protein